MKKTFFIITVLLFATQVFADNVKTVLKKATVYFSGAELTHVANVSLVQGENEITLEGLTPDIDINSLKVNVNNSVIVASSEFTNDYLTEKKSSDLVRKLQDSIDFCNTEMSRIATSIKINSTSLDLLKKGVETNLGGSVEGNGSSTRKGLSATELTQNLDFYNTKANSLEKSIATDTKQKNEFSATLVRLQQQIQHEQANKGAYNGLIKLNLMASYATNATITVTYFTQSARWTPFYDMIITDVTKPVQLKGKSKVRQTTGIDWNKINITLSTATPSKTKDAPVFSTWFLDYTNNYPLITAKEKNSISYDLQEMNTPDAKSVINIRGVSTVNNNAQPLFVVDGVPVGENPNIDPAMIENIETIKDASATEIYGSRGSNGVVLITTKQMEDFVIAKEKNISMEYTVDLPYTIPGNGKEQIIALKNYELNADYKYYCAPKLDENVFLVADFKDWEKLNILNGMANITYNGTYVGQTFLNTSQTNQVLSVTLGTDKRISVKREMQTNFSQVKSLGSESEVTLAYKITVKNNQNKPVKFTLKEQYPISSQKDIKVKLFEKETTTPTFNKEETGIITWDFDLAGGESKEFKIAYSVRYPKGEKINLM
jgi:TonB-dependent SusC/RagA subfamily outer membrane receptor